MVIEFSKGVALLLALCFLQSFIARRWTNNELIGQVLSGLLFGCICVIGMMTPIEAAPGVIFDARSVVLSMAGLFGGPVVGGIAAVIAGGYRAWLGGGGAPVGVAVVLSCVLLGLAYRHCHQRGWLQIGIPQLLAFGLLVHGVEVGLFTFLPADVVGKVMENIAIPLILAFTPATALLGALLRTIEVQVRITKSLADSEFRYRDLVEGSQFGMQISQQNGKRLYVNREFVKMFRFGSAEEVLSISDDGALVAPHHRQELLDRRDARRRGETVADIYQYDALRKDGTHMPVQAYFRRIDWDGNSALLRTYIDITGRRESEKALKESEARFRAFFDNSPSIMYAKDRDHNLTFVNAQYLAFHEVNEGEVIGKRGGSTLGKEKRTEVEELDNKVMSEGATSAGNIPMTSKAGDTRDFLVTKFPIYGAAGEITGIGGINTDVSELAKAKEEAEMLAEKAEAANRSKSLFLATMSHEIRTPMNGVLGMADLLARTGLTAEQHDFVQTIRESGRSLLDLLNDILDLSKIEAGRVELEVEQFSIAKLLAAANSLWLHPAQDKGLAFSIHNNTTNADMVRTDRTRLRQVLYNLIGNAIKFTSEGEIEIHVNSRPREDGGDELRFEVRDTGIGISAEEKEKLFQPFTQADNTTTRQFGGTGLGLTISKNLVELLGGEIGLESARGEGATFWFVVPVERGNASLVDDNAPSEVPTLPPENSDKRLLRILIAEDNNINQKVVSWLIDPLNAQIDIVENGLEAVSAVTRSEYDLVLMDIQMPEMDGIAATKQIRSLAGPKGQIPIIAMTANAMRGDREKYLQAGMNDYVAKPIDQRDLLSAIARSANVDIPVEDISPISPPLNTEEANQPLNEEGAEELDNLMGDLDNLLDGTGR